MRLSFDHNLRRAMLALVWLEKVYAAQCSETQRHEQYLPHGFRTETAKLLAQGLAGGACPTTNRRLVTSLDLDAPARYAPPLLLSSTCICHLRCPSHGWALSTRSL